MCKRQINPRLRLDVGLFDAYDVLMKTSHLFEPFPTAMAYDSAFFDRMHYYLPGWEIPKCVQNISPMNMALSRTI